MAPPSLLSAEQRFEPPRPNTQAKSRCDSLFSLLSSLLHPLAAPTQHGLSGPPQLGGRNCHYHAAVALVALAARTLRA